MTSYCGIENYPPFFSQPPLEITDQYVPVSAVSLRPQQTLQRPQRLNSPKVHGLTRHTRCLSRVQRLTLGGTISLLLTVGSVFWRCSHPRMTEPHQRCNLGTVKDHLTTRIIQQKQRTTINSRWEEINRDMLFEKIWKWQRNWTRSAKKTMDILRQSWFHGRVSNFERIWFHIIFAF